MLKQRDLKLALLLAKYCDKYEDIRFLWVLNIIVKNIIVLHLNLRKHRYWSRGKYIYIKNHLTIPNTYSTYWISDNNRKVRVSQYEIENTHYLPKLNIKTIINLLRAGKLSTHLISRLTFFTPADYIELYKPSTNLPLMCKAIRGKQIQKITVQNYLDILSPMQYISGRDCSLLLMCLIMVEYNSLDERKQVLDETCTKKGYTVDLRSNILRSTLKEIISQNKLSKLPNFLKKEKSETVRADLIRLVGQLYHARYRRDCNVHTKKYVEYTITEEKEKYEKILKMILPKKIKSSPYGYSGINGYVDRTILTEKEHQNETQKSA